MKLLEDYFKALENLFNYFGYDTKQLAVNSHYIEDCQKHYWYVEDETVYFASSKDELNKQCDDYYEEPISNVYRGAEYSLILINSGRDIGLCVFENSKETEPDWAE